MATYEDLSPGDVHDIAVSLKRLLTKTGMTLSRIAREAGVNQPMAHRVANMRIKKRTPAVKRLELYVHIKLGMRSSGDVASLDRDILEFVRAGGDLETLRALIQAFAVTIASQQNS